MNSRGTKGRICYGIFLVLYFLILCILKSLAIKEIINENIVKWGASIFFILFMLPFIVCFFVIVVKYFVGSLKNIHSCGDILFDELDYYATHWGETKEYYENMINVINFYYKEGGKVDTVVGKDLKRLYKRLEFLERELNTKEYFVTCISSVGLSICATIFFEYAFGVFEKQMGYAILFFVLFWAIALFRYFKIFNEASNQITKYEIKQIGKKIAKTEEVVSVDYQREDILLTKQNLLNILMNKCKFSSGKRCEDVVNDIRVIEKLHLNIQDTSGFKELKFRMGETDKEGVLFLDENNNMVNEQYELLYKILRKYNLIFEISEDEKK